MKRTIALLFLMLATAVAYSGTSDPADVSQAYSYLNKLRVRAGMIEFIKNQQLEKSAANHANYLADNFIEGHFETQGTPGFTGVEPKDRTSYAGYRSLAVSENVSSGNSDSLDSIDGLMSAIYHRIGFLDLVNNEIGIGSARVSQPNPYSGYVYNMGNSGYNALCQGPAFSGAGSYYYDVCQPNLNIDGKAFDNVTHQAQGNNPKIVQWPVDGDQEVPPVFYEESPDPLPDYSVSGYPITLQFNPLSFTKVNVTQFKLYRDQDNTEVTPTRLLNQKTDPNKKLSGLEFALFPLTRLEWNTSYRVEAKYTDDAGKENALTWRFKTRSLGVPYFTVTGKGEELSVPPTATFAVYVPPTKSSPTIGQINYSFSGGLNIQSSFKDGNTLLITLSGKDGQKAQFTFSGGRTFKVNVSANASLPKTDTASPNNTTVKLPSLKDAYAVNATGKIITTTAKFAGGIAVNGGDYQKQVVQNVSDTVDVSGEITVPSSHKGKVVDIFVYAETTLPPDPQVYYFMVGEGGTISFWDQKPANLVAFMKGVKLGATQKVTMYQGNFYFAGHLKVHFGYRLSAGTITTNGEAIEVTIK
jgi:uncharacterized protein YkwD